MSTKPTTEIRTRFTLGGLQSAAAGLRGFAGRARAAVQPAVSAVRRIGTAFVGISRAAVAASRRTVTAVRAIGAAALAATRRVAGLAAATSKLALGAAVGGGGALFGAVGAAVSSTSALVREQERLSRAAGTSTERMVGLTSAAAAYGAEADEVMGALSTLSDHMANVSRGEGPVELFERLGISATDANGKMRDSAAVLDDLMRSTRGLGRSERASIYNELLGGDAEKLAEFLDAGGSSAAKNFGSIARSVGAIATPRQVALTRAWWAAWERMRLSLRGLALTIAERFLPALTSDMSILARFVASRRGDIAGFLVRRWNAAIRVIRASIVPLQVVGALVAYTARLWTGYFHQLTGQSRSFEQHTMSATRALASAWLGALSIVHNAVGGLAGISNGENDFWLGMRAGILAVVGALRQLPQHIATAREFMSGLATTAVMSAQALIEAMPALLAIARSYVVLIVAAVIDGVVGMVDSAIDWVMSAIQPAIDFVGTAATAIADAWRLVSQGPDGATTADVIVGWKSEILNARAAVLEFVASLSEAWSWFTAILDVIMAIPKAVLEALGIDVTSATLFVGMLAFSGIIKGVIAAFGLLGTAAGAALGLGGGAAVGGTVAGAAAGGGLLGVLASIKGSIAWILRALPQVGVALGALAGGAALGRAAANGLDRLTGGPARRQASFDASMTHYRTANDISFDRRMQSLEALARRPAARTWSFERGYSDNPRPEWPVSPAAARARQIVDLNFNIGGHRRTVQAAPDVARDLVRDLTAAQRAGGLR